jgi:hypothetical protein
LGNEKELLGANAEFQFPESNPLDEIECFDTMRRVVSNIPDERSEYAHVKFIDVTVLEAVLELEYNF